MFFNSLEYAVFFPVVCILYYVMSDRIKKAYLLIVSYIFYMSWNPFYSLIMLFSTLTTFLCGIILDNVQKKHSRKLTLVSLLIINFGILFLFKYYSFFTTSLELLMNALGISTHIPSISLSLPLGISFYTFQAAGYTIDVYRRKVPAERDFVIYALFVSFFPQIASGPIQRSEQFIKQLKESHKFDYNHVTLGLKIMAIGFFKKMVIADTLAEQVNLVYNQIDINSAAVYIVATIFFAFQIYCDFSGYTDIAIGSAKVLGFDLVTNFDKPYFSCSIPEFWRRWHMSLSTWFRDYLYFPLGGNRVGKIKWYRNIMVVFLVSGLWHGANWTFVIWGIMHGGYQVFGKMTLPMRKKLISISRLDHMTKVYSLIQGIITFSLVCAAWVFFRANTVNDAFSIYGLVFKNITTLLNPRFFIDSLRFGLLRREPMLTCLLSIIFLLIYDAIDIKFGFWTLVGKMKPIFRIVFYVLLVFSFFWFMSTSSNEFIYAQF